MVAKTNYVLNIWMVVSEFYFYKDNCVLIISNEYFNTCPAVNSCWSPWQHLKKNTGWSPWRSWTLLLQPLSRRSACVEANVYGGVIPVGKQKMTVTSPTKSQKVLLSAGSAVTSKTSSKL